MSDQDDFQVIGPSDVIASLLRDSPSLLSRSQDLIGPVRREREGIRAFFQEKGMLSVMDEQGGGYQVGCTDGGYTTSPFIIGDHIATMSVAVTQRDDANTVGVVAHRQWSDFRGHSVDAEALAKGVMMAHEVELLAALPADSVKMIDGSFLTHLTSIFMALSSPEDDVREVVGAAVSTEGFERGLREMAENPRVIACPKSDSATFLWSTCSQALGIQGGSIPDKALANLVLESGEVLNAGPAFSWERLRMAKAHVTAPEAKKIAERIWGIIEHLLAKGTVNVYFAKAHHSNLALRIEAHSGLDPFEAEDIIASVCDTVTSPFLQEPLPQYVADIFAKKVAVGTSVQIENLRLDLDSIPDSRDIVDYFVRYYRTN